MMGKIGKWGGRGERRRPESRKVGRTWGAQKMGKNREGGKSEGGGICSDEEWG